MEHGLEQLTGAVDLLSLHCLSLTAAQLNLTHPE